MQYHMSSASVPSTLPARVPPPQVPPPAILHPVPRKPRKFGIWILLSVVLAAAAGFAWYSVRRANSGSAGSHAATVRMATISVSDLQRTVRVSGVIAAERFAALTAPQLRGSRGTPGGGGMRQSQSLVGNAPGSSGSSGSTSGAGSSTSSTSTSGTGGASNQTATGTSTSTNTALNGQSASSGVPGGPASSLGALRGTQNRFGDRTAAAANAKKGSTAAKDSSKKGQSSTLGSNGLGSTATNLINGSMRGGGGGGGMGGGGSDFALVLVEVAKPGARVKKGEIVAEFDRQYQLNRLDDFKDRVIQLDANVKKLRADLAVAKEAHNQVVLSAKSDWDKAILDLKTAEVRSAIESEKLRLSVEEADARYKQMVEEAKLVEASQRAQMLATEIDRDQAKIEFERASANVNRMVVRAPMDGVVVMQTIWRGGDFGQVQQGDQVWPGMTFMQIVDPSSMVIMGNLNQVDADAVRLNQQAVARLDAYSGSEFPAHVAGVGAMTKPGVWRPNYMREIPIRLKLDTIDARVIPDLSASADIVLTIEKQAAIAPLDAVFHDPQGKPFVFLRTPSGWQRRSVELGLSNHIAATVRSGLRRGDVVAAERPDAAKPPS